MNEKQKPFGISFDQFIKDKGKMMDSGMFLKIQQHIFNCPYCTHLSGSLGFLIEQHMNEKEETEKLT